MLGEIIILKIIVEKKLFPYPIPFDPDIMLRPEEGPNES